MGYPEDRTHGADSAIDDNLIDTSDAAFDGAPHQSASDQEGKILLEYNVQNFNMLVAANATMQTEISNLEQQIQRWSDRVGDQQAFLKTVQETLAEERATIKELKGKLDTAGFDRDYAEDKQREIERKFDRQSGYLDRVLDDEDGRGAICASPPAAPLERPPVGPDFSEIAPPRRRSPATQAADTEDWRTMIGGDSVRGFAARIAPHHSGRPRR